MVSVTGNAEQRTSIVHFHMPLDSDTALKVPIQGRAEVAYEVVHEFYETDGSALPESGITESIISALAFGRGGDPAKVYTGKLSDQITNEKLRTLELKGLPGSWTAIDQSYALTVKGFRPVGVANTQITPDGSAEAVIRYERNRYKVTYNLAGGLLNGQSYKQAEYYSYGQPISAPIAPERTGYEFVNWAVSYSEDGGQTVNVDDVVAGASFAMKDAEVTVTAVWKIKTIASYTVEFWVQSVYDSYKTANENKKYDYHCSTVVQNGVVGTAVSIDRLSSMASSEISNKDRTRINIDNFDMLIYNQVNTERLGRKDSSGNAVTIKADGSTTYKIFIDRAIVTYTFNYKYGNHTYTPSNNTGAITTPTFDQVTQNGTYAVYGLDTWHGTGYTAWFGHDNEKHVVADGAQYYSPDGTQTRYDDWHQEGNTWWFGHGEYVNTKIREWNPANYTYTWTEGYYENPEYYSYQYTKPDGYGYNNGYFDWFILREGYTNRYQLVTAAEAKGNSSAIYAHAVDRHWQSGGLFQNGYYYYSLSDLSDIIDGVTAPVSWTEDVDGITWHLNGVSEYSTPNDY